MAEYELRSSDWRSDVCADALDQKRGPEVSRWGAAREGRRGDMLSMRLVKSAYSDTEIERAQTLGRADFPVFTAKLHTDLNYLHCAQSLRECQDCLFPAFASHKDRKSVV